MQQPRRLSLRLLDYDYTTPGAYFLTVCAAARECLFGRPENDSVELSQLGEMVRECWLAIPNHFTIAELDAYVVMPNHLRGIIVLTDDGRGKTCRAPTTERFGQPVAASLPTIVRSFKAAVTKRVNEIGVAAKRPIWQRSYYEHVIRNAESLDRIRDYIATNPLRWNLDRENPASTGSDEFDRWLAGLSARSSP